MTTCNHEATSYPPSWQQCPNCKQWYDTIYSSSDPNYKVHQCPQPCNHDWASGTNGYICRKCLVWRGEESNEIKVKNFECSEHGKQKPIISCSCPKCHQPPRNTLTDMPLEEVVKNKNIQIIAPQKDWKEEFDKLWVNGYFDNFYVPDNVNVIRKIKSFISNLLISQKQKYANIIQGLDDTYREDLKTQKSQLIKEIEEEFQKQAKDIVSLKELTKVVKFRNAVLTLLKT